MSRENKMSWEEIKDGYGLQEIPLIVAREACCAECLAPGTGSRKLYTDQRPPTTSRDLTQFIRSRIWCKVHAQWLFEEIQ